MARLEEQLIDHPWTRETQVACLPELVLDQNGSQERCVSFMSVALGWSMGK